MDRGLEPFSLPLAPDPFDRQLAVLRDGSEDLFRLGAAQLDDERAAVDGVRPRIVRVARLRFVEIEAGRVSSWQRDVEGDDQLVLLLGLNNALGTSVRHCR